MKVVVKYFLGLQNMNLILRIYKNKNDYPYRLTWKNYVETIPSDLFIGFLLGLLNSQELGLNKSFERFTLETLEISL